MKRIKELPDNPDTNELRQQYEHWDELFTELEKESDI